LKASVITTLLVIFIIHRPGMSAISLTVSSCGSATSCSSASFTTPLTWTNTASDAYPYTPVTLSVSGNNGNLTWKTIDPSGADVTVSGLFGTISGSSASSSVSCTAPATTCYYWAPHEYPSGQTATIVATDTALSSATVLVTFSFKYHLNEWFVHRARLTGFLNKPYSGLCQVSGMSMNHCQPEQVIFFDPLSGRELNIMGNPSVPWIGDTVPNTAGSGVERPSWSYNGEWFEFGRGDCTPNLLCYSSSLLQWAARADGSLLQSFAPGLVANSPGNATFVWDYNQPSWLLASNTSPNQIYVVDLDHANAQTIVASSLPTGRTFASHGEGTSRYFVKEANAICPSGTSGSLTCFPYTTLFRSPPNYFVYDMTNCEASLTPNCLGPPLSSWSISLGYSGYDGSGNAHCTTIDSLAPCTGANCPCEYHIHDTLYLRGGKHTVGLGYGTQGAGGEAIFWQIADTGAAGKSQIFPNQATNVPNFGHPANNWSGDLWAYDGATSCTPQGNSCIAWGDNEQIWDMRSNTVLNYVDNKISTGHSFWDGFDNNFFGYDGRPTTGPLQPSHWYTFVADNRPSVLAPVTIFDWGTRDYPLPFLLLRSGTQSPDATKIAQDMPTSFSCSSLGCGSPQASLVWVARVHDPYPPVAIALVSSTADTVGWTPHPLNREVKTYHLWKQAGCSGTWSRLGDVATVYATQISQGQYTYTDPSPPSVGSNACYAITSEEWAGVESSILSAVLMVTATTGPTYSGSILVGGGTTKFKTSAPGSVSAFSAASVKIPNSSGVYSPYSQGTGGSLADGTYWFCVVYANFSDFPANTPLNAKTTRCQDVKSITVSGGGTASINIGTPISEFYGQVAVQIYGNGPATSQPSALYLQTCGGAYGQSTTWIVPYGNGFPGAGVTCVIKSLSNYGPIAPTYNTTVLGYRLNWTEPPDTDIRYYAIYYDDTAAPSLSLGRAAQPQLIATVPKGTTSYLDYTPNWYRIYSHSGGPYYGIVAVDREGNRSAPVCLRGATGIGVTCN